jgi:hypothetical protein
MTDLPDSTAGSRFSNPISFASKMASRKRKGWSRPLTIPSLMTMRTLADVRVLLGHLPEQYQAKETWRHVADALDDAARGGDPGQYG